MIIKDFVMIFAFVSVIVNMTEGRLKEYGAKKKYFETPFGKKLMKNFLANGEGKEGVPDGKYAHMLGMVLKRTRRGKRGESSYEGNKLKGSKIFKQRIQQFLYGCQKEHYAGYHSLDYFDRWLKNPYLATPGTRFVFAGIRKRRERMDLIAYMSDKRWTCCRYPKVPFVNCVCYGRRCDEINYNAFGWRWSWRHGRYW